MVETENLLGRRRETRAESTLAPGQIWLWGHFHHKSSSHNCCQMHVKFIVISPCIHPLKLPGGACKLLSLSAVETELKISRLLLKNLCERRSQSIKCTYMTISVAIFPEVCDRRAGMMTNAVSSCTL